MSSVYNYLHLDVNLTRNSLTIDKLYMVQCTGREHMRVQRILISLFLVVVLPVILQSFFLKGDTQITAEDVTESSLSTVDAENREIMIRILKDDEVFDQSVEDYVCSVLLAEMPASFESEALKAQAVATRTYTLRKIAGAQKHSDADVCTDPGCCQAYKSMLEIDNVDIVEKIRSAVKDTEGEVLIYDGALIDATYFSSSGGRTESAIAVWGKDVPYLQAKDSPEEADTKYYRDQISFEEQELLHQLGFTDTVQSFTYKDITFTDGNGVDTVNICGKTFTGLQLRNLLRLRSTAFDIEIQGDTVIFVTRGYGHRVGMSQYGAQSMAKQGRNHQQILSYYYPNTELVTLDREDLCRLFDKEDIL